MKSTLLKSVAAVGLALLGATSAHSITLTNTNGANSFTGFDFDANGTAFTTGFTPVAGDTFNLEFFSWATTVKNNATNLFLPGLDNNADGSAPGPNTFEYTVYAILNEQVDSCTAGGISCTFNVLSGDFYVYYDTSPDADSRVGSLGTGFRDGALLIQGTFAAQPGGTFTVAGSGGQGNTVLQGLVSSTNLTYINPALTSTVVGTTLQLGSSQTNSYISPGGFNGSVFAPDSIVFQADANQSFVAATVPEPASLGLIGIALLAAGWGVRSKKAK